MPARNIIKIDVDESYYHVYARGASQQNIFLNESDYQYFLNLFARYLSHKPVASREGAVYPHLRGSVELLAFCLVPNHFHFLLYQHQKGSMPKLMRCIMTSYSRYFNLKYQRTGSLFESRYKASRIDADSYLTHISRYIHLNTRYWQRYPYSSYQYYQSQASEWLETGRILALFANKEEYAVFHADHQEHKTMLGELKSELANQ